MDTKLVHDALGSRGSNMEEFKKELSKKRNIRVMTPNEIGDSMIKSLQYDKVTIKIKYYFKIRCLSIRFVSL